MNNLKARIKGTDRVIEVVSYSHDNNWIEYEKVVDGQVRYDTMQLDEVELIVDNAPSPIDWGKMCSEIAREIFLQEIKKYELTKQNSSIASECAVFASAIFVKMLIGAVGKFERLKGGEQ